MKDEAELRRLWSSPDTRSKLLQGLAEKGFGAEHSDLFDVLAHVAYALPRSLVKPARSRPASTSTPASPASSSCFTISCCSTT